MSFLVLSGTVAATEKPRPHKHVTVKHIKCMFISGEEATPIRGYRYEAGDFRCAVRVHVSRRYRHWRVPVSLSLIQRGYPETGDTDKEVDVVVGHRTKKVLLWPGFKHDIWIQVPDKNTFNGCMDFKLKATVAGHSKWARGVPDRPD